jgi:hypothetical protein
MGCKRDDLQRVVVKGGHGSDNRPNSRMPDKEVVISRFIFVMKIVSKHIVKGSVRVYIATQCYGRTVSRDISKSVQKKMKTCGICITSFER